MPTFGNASPALAEIDPPVRTDERERAETRTSMNTETAPNEIIYPHGRWTLKVNPFKSSVVPVRRSVVQGKLALGQVKVVRNDLSDSDLELVVKKPASFEAAKHPGRVAAPADLATRKTSLWGRIKTRLSVANIG